ncbi:hypothetical protein [Natronolimnohabitans innermongolicus]|uniref:Uncharacterized protein n=1 Tax=Natronolimnohabitans innermongolicus JCM 12255 TaxID=1227499 RepID=L9XAZ4_9EURY|nr:hypothetical protein [Natronolimnohabitans innermongolicus]ELY58909.1 hypothetical protein C493_05670 [Natronolimnohabitans innermongolicus JCM 12255]
MYARNPERDAIWNDVLEWMICRGLPLRPREIDGYDPGLVRDVLETMVLEGWVEYDARGDFFEPGPRVERFDASGPTSRRGYW